MVVAGVDGCPGGWIMVTYDSGRFHYRIHHNFEELLTANPTIDRILIDIPIGLTSPGYPRTIDHKLRRQLPGRGSTVFNTPVRAAVYASHFEEARQINKQMVGKSLSIQSLHLIDKIKQIDKYLTYAPKEAPKIYESHPELCFKSLNKGIAFRTRKSTKEGLQDRLTILGNHDPSIEHLFHDILSNTLRKRVRRDDIVDAMCLCLVNKLALSKELQFLSDENVEDEYGIEIRIAY